jgi:hypothetical protein
MLSALNRAWLSRPPYRADKAAEDGPTSNRERIAPPTNSPSTIMLAAMAQASELSKDELVLDARQYAQLAKLSREAGYATTAEGFDSLLSGS